MEVWDFLDIEGNKIELVHGEYASRSLGNGRIEFYETRSGEQIYISNGRGEFESTLKWLIQGWRPYKIDIQSKGLGEGEDDK